MAYPSEGDPREPDEVDADKGKVPELEVDPQRFRLQRVRVVEPPLISSPDGQRPESPRLDPLVTVGPGVLEIRLGDRLGLGWCEELGKCFGERLGMGQWGGVPGAGDLVHPCARDVIGHVLRAGGQERRGPRPV
jgi:hypothetical protein